MKILLDRRLSLHYLYVVNNFYQLGSKNDNYS